MQDETRILARIGLYVFAIVAIALSGCGGNPATPAPNSAGRPAAVATSAPATTHTASAADIEALKKTAWYADAAKKVEECRKWKSFASIMPYNTVIIVGTVEQAPRFEAADTQAKKPLSVKGIAVLDGVFEMKDRSVTFQVVSSDWAGRPLPAQGQVLAICGEVRGGQWKVLSAMQVRLGN